MAKDSVAVSRNQASENPLVTIKYEPENALASLATDAAAVLKRVEAAKITNPTELQTASGVLDLAEIRAESIESFKATLRERIQQATARFREIPGFEDFEITLTVRKWTLNQRLMDAIRSLKNRRAQYLADEQAKLRRKQLEAQAEQDRINKKAADEAAKAAKASGADKQTVQDIKQAVLATPAPIVESKAQAVAEDVGASLRFSYTAKVTDLKAFLQFCLSNGVMLATLNAAIPEIEKAFRKMATDQKEQFNYPGITHVKKPVDVSTGGRW